MSTFFKALSASAAALALPLAALAQTGPDLGVGGEPRTPGDLVVIICNIVNWMFWGLIVLTIIFILVAAYKYLTAAGSPEKVKAAGNTLLYAVVAVVVGLLAKGVPYIIASFIGASLTGTAC